MKTLAILRQLFFPWAFTGFLPLPVLMALPPSIGAEIKCLYLGIASAWLATELFRPGAPPDSRRAWRERWGALFLALCVNVSLFILLGLSIGIRTHIPFPWMAVLAAVPAIGMVPWLSLQVAERYAVIVFGGTLVFVAKLAACVVARLVYGPNYIEEGRVASDWNTAPLMISLFWALTILMSLALLWMSYRSARWRELHDATLA
ncbi:MAG: hypothetical protein AB7G28_18840 [Pirellulales bacterium]